MFRCCTLSLSTLALTLAGALMTLLVGLSPAIALAPRPALAEPATVAYHAAEGPRAVLR